VTRILVVVIGLGNALVGVWAALAPHSFYDDFPGGGRHWVAVDGPFNEHLVRDVGTLNLALLAVAVAALLRSGPYLVRVLAVAELVYTVPHFVYHGAHLDGFDATDQVGLMLSLGITVLAPLLLLLVTGPLARTSVTPSQVAPAEGR
jgi:DMSO/TMAO reductase YedYZ heme-binding membrane subunit